MAHSILLVVPRPHQTNTSDGKLWEEALENLSDITRQNTEIEALGANVLLIPLDGTLRLLLECLSEVGKLPYRYAIFDEDIQWHEVKKVT
ncbi:MAG: hypothetical protein ACE144_13960 [Thermodesulfobacteriota bacterium]